MTEQETIKHLELCKKSRMFIPNNDVLDVSIKALEEVQQLRNEMWELNQICRDYTSLGTVEELKELKEIDYDCSIKHLTGECSYNETGCSGCIGREKIRKALEKQIAKKVIDCEDEEVWYMCPCCKGDLTRIRSFYCGYCGQKLDWGNEDAE